jgi:periplasmic divalent cation tolerance protein
MTEVPPGSGETIIEVWVNCPDEETASAIAEMALSERLSASANIYPPISSLYRWRGKIERAREIPLLLKTRKSLFDQLADRISALHPYDTPSIVGIDVRFAHGRYRAWVNDETTP